VDQLQSISDPRLVTPEKISTGRVLYHIRDPKNGQTRTKTQDEIFHLRGASEDGVVGQGILEYARGSLGTSLATESYAAKIFSAGTLSGGAIKVPGKLDPEASKRMAASFVTASGQWHLPKVLEQGAEWVQSTMTPEDAQMLLSRKFSVDDIARWLGVPPHMIGSLDRSTNNNIEQQGREFVTFSLGPWLALFEFAIQRQLILNKRRFYAEFMRDGLVIGDMATRWEAYTKAVSTGTFTRNEVRRKENMNKLPGLDKPLDPAHLTGKQSSSAQPPAKTAPEPDPEDDTEARLQRGEAIARASAARLLRKEITAVQKAAVKYAASQDKFLSWVETFYGDPAELVADTLQVDRESAVAYCASQASQVRAGWIAAVDVWQSASYASGLAALALEGVAA
jgi:HK97 family phage portal protein